MALKYFNVLSGISAGNITINAANNTVVANEFVGNVTGTVLTSSQPNITSLGTLANLSVSGNVNLTGPNVSLGSVSNLKITGGSAGQVLTTDGTGTLTWTSSSSSSISNGTSNVNIATANGNITMGVTGTANVVTVSSTSINRGNYELSGMVYQANAAPANPRPGDQWYNTFNGILFEYLNDGTNSQWVDISTAPTPNLVSPVAQTIEVSFANSGLAYPTFITQYAETNLTINANSAFSANLSNGALYATTFVGSLSGTATSATTAGTVTTAAQPNITSVGTLSSLTVTGNVFAGNVSGTLLTGTLTTAAQPNITSVGTLTSLSVSGALTTTNITAGANTTAGTVTGNWTLTAGSRWQSTYADLAERYQADNAYEPGTVVVLGGEHEVTVEGSADSHKVAGVVTTNPAYIMNTELEGENVVEVTLIGRVPCKVIGPVTKGDLLTTAEIAGYAHSNNNASAGRIIGKSLENFSGTEGVIEIMVGRT